MDEQPQHERDDSTTVLRLEEEPRIGVQEQSSKVHIRKRVETHPVEETMSRTREDVSLEHAPAAEHDSGEIETLPDGSLSIPVLEEELVVTRRTVVRERIIVRKQQVTEEQQVNMDLRRERVEIEEEGR